MPTDKIKDVYDLISDKGYFTDENEFRSYVNDPKKIKEVYSLIQDDGFFKDEKEFEGYFSDVKKKEPATTSFVQGVSDKLGLKPSTPFVQSDGQGLPSKTAATTTQLDFTRPQPRLSAEEQQAQGMVTKQQKAEKALEFKEGVKQKLYDNNRYWLLQNKKEAQENGMTLKELQASRRKELANNYLDDSEQREANSILDHLDAKKSGDDKRAGEALKQYYAAKNEQRAKFQSDMQNLQAEYDNIASRIEGGELDADLGLQTLEAIQKRQKNLELSQKAFLKPKEALKNFVQENATEIASVSKPTQTPYEQLEEYTNNLYAKVRQLKADLGYQDMGKGATLGGYAQDYAIRAEQDGGELLDELYAEELKLKTATKLLLLNRTPIQADETALGVLGKSFGNSLAPNLQKEQGTAVTIANNVKEIVEDAKIGEKVYEEQKKFAEESAKPYETYSAKWFAEPVGASLAIVPEFIIGSFVSEGVLGVTKLGKLLTLAEKYGKIKGLNTTAKYVNAINKNAAGKVTGKLADTFIKTQANGLKFGATSEVVSKLFPSQEDEIGFINGYFGGNIGKGAELALSGAAKNLFKVFGNKGAEAAKKISELGGTLKLLKDAPKTVLGEVGEEFGESLGQIYKQSSSWKEVGEKIKEQYGTLDKATEFVVLTGIMALGMGAGNSIGANLFTASKEAYNELPREQRAIVDSILDQAKAADKQVEETVAEDIKKDIAKDLTPAELKEIETTTEETDEQRGIEEPISAGTDVLETGVGMAAEPGKEGITGEDIQAEKVLVPRNFKEETITEAIDNERGYLEKEILSEEQYIAERKNKKSKFRKILDKLSGVTYDKYLKAQQNRLSLLNENPLAYFEKELADEKKWQEKHPEDANENLINYLTEVVDNFKSREQTEAVPQTPLEEQQAPEVISETVSEIEPPVVEQTTTDVGGVTAPNVSEQIADLRAKEQAEYSAMANPKDKAKRKEIYDKYDKLITPLLEEQKATETTPALKDVESTAKALDKKFNPEFKNTIVDKLSKFDKQIEDKKFPSVLEVAEHILPRSIFNKYKNLYELAARNNITVSNEKLPYGFTASWAYGNIQLNKDVLKYYIENFDEFSETLNHEIIHGLLSRGIRNNYALFTDLQDVMGQVVSKFDSASDEVKNIISYIQDTRNEFVEKDILGATEQELDSDKYREVGSLEELITYAFTNKEFANFLDSIPASKDIKIKGDSIFQQLKNIIRDFISNITKSPTALDEINSVLDKYFDTNWNESQIAERNKTYEWNLRFSANKNVFDKYKNDSNKISEAYHKAKADGSNPELVKAVEELLGQETSPSVQATQPTVEEGGDLGYHGGNLMSKSDYLTSGYRGDMPFTGHYFFSDRVRAEARGNRTQTENKEVSVVDFSKYNLLKPTTNEYWSIKAGLKRFEDRFLRNGIESAFESLESYGGMKDGAEFLYEQMVKNKEKIQKVAEDWKENELGNIDKKKQIERLETLILKELGYEGIDVRGLKESNGEASPDSSSEGSVIFDLKPESIVESPSKQKEVEKAEPAKEAAKPTKTERKAIAEAKIDDLAAKAKEFLRNKNLPEGTKVSGVSQDKVIDILASTVKALVNSGIEIAEAIKQVREYFEQDFDTSGIKDYEIAQKIARDELTDVAKDNGFSSYREAVFAVNKYVREVGEEDVITEEEITKAKEAKDKEAEAPKKGYTSKKKQAQEGEKESTIKETGRSKSYAEGRVPVSEAYNDVVNAQKEYYEQMNRKEELANAEGYLASFGNTEEGLLDAYIDMMEVFRTNPYLDPKNSIAIEILADRMFAMAIDFRDKGQTDKYNNFLEKSEKLRKEAFQAHFRAGQYTSAVAVFSRSANPDAFLIFVEGQQAQEFEKAKKSKPEKIKEYEAAVNDFYEKAKEIKKDAARQAVVSAPNSTTKVNVKLSDKLKARYEQGKARQAEALKKLGKINFFGSSGLSNEAIEAVGELVLSQFEQGIYKAATIIERIIEITEGKLTEKNIKDVYDAYKVNYKGEKLTLTELEEVLRKEEIAEKQKPVDTDAVLEKEREKLAKIKADYEQAVVDKADALVLKRAQQFVKDQEKKVKEQEDKAKKAATAKTAEGKRPTLSDLIQRELEADSTKEQIAKELVEKGGLSEREANKLAEIYYNKYRKILKEKITSQLLKDLTPKKVKQIEAQMNALKDKPYGKTLGGMIANQVAAGALDSEILRAAFAEKYGLPNISPVQADIIRDLARKARAAKTQLGLQTANKNLLEYVNSFVKPKYGSLLGTLYYMGLLTGVSTAAVNTFGNVNGLINQSTENFVQSVIEAIQGNKGNLMSSSKPAQKILMAIANMNDSLSAAIDILIHGGGESRYSNIKKDAFGEITTEDLIVKRKDFKDLGFKKLFTTLFKLYKTPPALFIRNLPASDEGFTMANFNMEATRELRKKLYAEGYRGADLEKKLYEQVYGTTEIKAKALQEAIKELKRIGIDPANRKILANRIAKEIIANSLDEKVQNVANEVAKENTFRGKPRGMAGYLSRKIPQTWLISPFVTTPSRILEKHMNYIPLYGILRYYGYGFSDNLRKTFPGLEKDFTRKGIESSKREGELRNKQLAQVLATHALLLVFWGLSQIDWEDEKGNVVPFVDASAGYMGTDIEERKKLEDLMPAYMIRIGNFKFSYKTNPLLAMIALPLGVIKDAERSFETADYSKSAFAYNFELFNFLYESNPIEGYQDFFEGLSKSFRTIKEEMTLESIAALPVKMAADFSSNVAVDNFYKQIVDFTDPLVHEAQDLVEVIYKAFNMEKIGDLTPTHDRWGRPVKRYPGESFFPLQHLFNNNDDKKITEWEIKNGIEIPTINRKTLVLTNNTLKTEKQIKNQREELVKDYGLTSDEVKYFDEALNSDFKLLTKDEWNKMSETIRYDVFTIIKNNFDNATEEYKKFYKESINSEERNIKPISKLSRPDAKKLVEILFKIKKREYINNNFTKIE